MYICSLFQDYGFELKKSSKYLVEACSYYFSHGFSIFYTNKACGVYARETVYLAEVSELS